MALSTVAALVLFLLVLAGFTVMLSGHDTPNAIALPVRSGALTPGYALILAAIMRFLGALIAALMVSYASEELAALFPTGSLGLMGLTVAIATAFGWGVITWMRGVPISNSQALTAGIIGAALALNLTGAASLDGSVIGGTIFLVSALLLSPILGVALAWVLGFFVLWIFRDSNSSTVNTLSRMTLAISSAGNALVHGVQHGARIHLLILIGFSLAGVPLLNDWWVAVVVGLLLAAGTFLGGWKIAFTLTERLTILDPLRSATASVSSALLLIFGAFVLHLPISSTVATVGSIVGAGHQQAHSSVRWIQVGRIGTYFVLTIALNIVVALLVTAALTPVWTG